MTESGQEPGEARIIPLARPSRRATPAAPKPSASSRPPVPTSGRKPPATDAALPEAGANGRSPRPAAAPPGHGRARADDSGPVQGHPEENGTASPGTGTFVPADGAGDGRPVRARAGRAAAPRGPRNGTARTTGVRPARPAADAASDGAGDAAHADGDGDPVLPTETPAPDAADTVGGTGHRPGAVRAGRTGTGRARPTRVAADPEPPATAGPTAPPEEETAETTAPTGGSEAPPPADDRQRPRLFDAMATAAREAVAAAEAAAGGPLAAAADLSGISGAPIADPAGLERALAGMLAFLRRRITGDYEVDELGFDPDLTEHVVAPLLRPVYRNYFRVETRGLENVPDTGGALVVANHSGTLPIDALMVAVALLDHHPAHRYLRMLAADLVFSLPFLAPLARKTGNTLACQADAERLLGKGELVGVWPEGFKGVGKPFSERYKLQRFGRGGFVSAALRTGAPIIPCTIVGAEEIYPMLGNARTAARLLGLPYVPLTPTFPWLGALGLIPLPSKWLIEFGEPVPTEHLTPASAEDPMLVFELTDRIRETIQHTLYGLLMQRRSVFF
jgi:1-acyl-sn-glycerol-3-phosphate acyltransferase